MIEVVIDQRRRSIGSFEVGRVLPSAERHMVGPFIFFDHIGPVDPPKGLPRDADVRPHPHIGLSTVTYLFAGEVMHRDSTGIEQAIRPDEINWMTAGSGITHSERFERARRQGGPLHGIQSWVALPEGEEETTPSFLRITKATICRCVRTAACGYGSLRGRRSGCAPRSGRIRRCSMSMRRSNPARALSSRGNMRSAQSISYRVR
jgi:redox-sensitive bicupin YhaK (pirin superfamily)